MDNMHLSIVEFMSRFEKFKVDEVSIEKAEDDICFNAQDLFEGASDISLNGLKNTKDMKALLNGKKEKKDTLQTLNSQPISRNY